MLRRKHNITHTSLDWYLLKQEKFKIFSTIPAQYHNASLHLILTGGMKQTKNSSPKPARCTLKAVFLTEAPLGPTAEVHWSRYRIWYRSACWKRASMERAMARGGEKSLAEGELLMTEARRTALEDAPTRDPWTGLLVFLTCLWGTKHPQSHADHLQKMKLYLSGISSQLQIREIFPTHWSHGRFLNVTWQILLPLLVFKFSLTLTISVAGYIQAFKTKLQWEKTEYENRVW